MEKELIWWKIIAGAHVGDQRNELGLMENNWQHCKFDYVIIAMFMFLNSNWTNYLYKFVSQTELNRMLCVFYLFKHCFLCGFHELEFEINPLNELCVTKLN